jgi:hypothetical protein
LLRSFAGLSGTAPHLSANLVLKAAMRVEKRRPNKGLRRDATRELFRASRELFLPEQGIFLPPELTENQKAPGLQAGAKLIHSSAVV